MNSDQLKAITLRSILLSAGTGGSTPCYHEWGADRGWGRPCGGGQPHTPPPLEKKEEVEGGAMGVGGSHSGKGGGWGGPPPLPLFFQDYQKKVLDDNSFEEPLQVLLEVHPSLRSGFTSHEPLPARMRQGGLKLPDGEGG